MAGAGFKTFNTGDVLLASEVNTYLMQQTVMVFDDATARTSALGANVAEGMFSYLKDTNLTYRYDGSAWLSDAGTTSPLTTKGDIWGYSTTDARIPVGANGTVLTADSAEALGVKWAAASSGAFTFITRQTFSAVATADIDSVFSSTYETYQIVIEECFSSQGNDDLYFQLRYAGPTTQTASYYGLAARLDTTYNTVQSSNASQLVINDNIRSSTGQASNGTIWINQVGNGSRNPILYSINHSGSYIVPVVSSGFCLQAREYTGFRLTAQTGNLTANVSVYGLAKS